MTSAAKATSELPKRDTSDHLPVPRRRRILFVLAGLFALLLAWQGRPWTADLANWRGRSALNARELDAARNWFQWANGIYPGTGEAEFWLARLDRLQGQPQQMRKHLTQAQQLGFPPERLRREELLALAQSGRMRDIAAEIPELLTEPEDDGPAICEAIVSGYLLDFRIKEAMVILEAWRQDFPGDAQPLVIRGTYFAQRQNWSKSAEEFAKALELAPGRVDARLQWAESLRNLHQLEAAREQFERCRQVSPRDPAVLVGLGRCWFESGELDRARQDLEAALRIAPDSWDGRLWLGKLLAADGDPAAAVPLLEAVVRDRPYEPDARYSLALALQAAGRREAAREHFEYVSAQQQAQSVLRNKLETLEREPQRADVRLEIGLTLLEYGNPDEGVGWLKSVLEVEPDHPEALAALAEHSRESQTPTQSFSKP